MNNALFCGASRQSAAVFPLKPVCIHSARATNLRIGRQQCDLRGHWEVPGLFKIPSSGGQPVRIVSTVALNPVWEPDGKLIVYSGANVGPTAPLLAVRPDGVPVGLPAIKVRVEGERYRFLPNGTSLVYMQGISPSQDFWMLDLATKKMRQLTKLENTAAMRTFDITPDGKQIVFDRLRDNSDIVLIDIPQ